MKRWLSLLLFLALLPAVCTGCGAESPRTNIYTRVTGIAPDETVMTVSGNEIPAELYFYWLSRACGYMYDYFLYSPAMFTGDGALDWDADGGEGRSLREEALDFAENTVKLMAAIENLAAEQSVSLTAEDQAAIDQEVTDMVEQYGGAEAFYARMGLSDASNRRVSAAARLLSRLAELVRQEGSPLYLEPAGYDRYAVCADHILLATVDPSTGEPLDEAATAAKYAAAGDLLSQLRSAEDPVSLFAQLADTYSEDPDRASCPDGAVYLKSEGDAFVQAAAALEPGQISDIVETGYGYHIILRKDLAPALAADPAWRELLSERHVSALAEALMNEDVVRSEKLDGIDAGAFDAAYLAELNAVTAGDTVK